MADKLYKARLLTDKDEVDLAWNIHKIDVQEGILVLEHARGSVIHMLAPGETVSLLEQFKPEEEG